MKRLCSIVINLVIILVSVEALKNAFLDGEQYSYQLSNDVFVKDFKNGKPVAYRLVGGLKVVNILSADDSKLLKFTLNEPQLHVRPHGSDSQTEFHFHKSPLDSYKNNDFYAIWKSGNISDIYYQANENVALINIKKAIVSLFQYRMNEGEFIESGSAGRCDVRYREISQTGVRQMKQNCILEQKIERMVRPEQPLQMSVQSYRSADYRFFPDGSIDKIESRDYFHIALAANREIGGSVDSIVTLQSDENVAKLKTVDSKSPKEYLSQLKDYKSEGLETTAHNVESKLNGNIKKVIKQHEDALSSKMVGTVQSSKAFLNSLPIARTAKKDDIVQLLKHPKLAEIKPQILDILGAVGTLDAHEAVKQAIDFSDDNENDSIERYLQALAVGVRSNAAIISDLLQIVESKSINDKIKATIIHTVGSMARRYANSPDQGYASKTVVQVQKYFTDSIAKCSDPSCYVQYLNGISNLQSTDLIELLFKYVNDADRTVSVSAMKALRRFPSHTWNDRDVQQFENIFYQHEQRFDSSVRTLALDIVLSSKITDEKLTKLLSHLRADDRAFEVKKYLLEMVKMLGSENAELNARVEQILKSDSQLNNYHVMGQKGLTTALSRKYSTRSPFNGTLTSIQESFGGILKRGVVDLSIDSSNSQYSYFTLGLYSNGLSSFVSSETESSEDNDENQDETVNAGMEITVQGAYLRPLQFFNGQGELMGHVWSGTASEPTPAYVATSLLHDHHELLQLQNGATVRVDVDSALSIDLNGAIQLSLWGRNAKIQVNKNVGLYIVGKILVNAGFVTLDLNFNVEKEPKLNLKTDVDFSSENVLCMQLSQPNDVFRYEMEKNQIIPDIQHHVKSIKKFKHNTIGITHNLNEKNNEMCRKIFSS